MSNNIRKDRRKISRQNFRSREARKRLIQTWRYAKKVQLPSQRSVVTFISVIILSSLFIGWRSSAITQYNEVQVKFFQIGTGPTSDKSFNFGHKIATSISKPPGSANCVPNKPCGVDNLIAIAKVTKGAVANIHNVNSGRIDSAFVYSDIAQDAFNGENSFLGNRMQNLRSLGKIYPATIHLIVAKSSKIKYISDLKGKKVSINVNNDPTNIQAKRILGLHDIRLDEMQLLKTSTIESSKLMKSGSIDAFFLISMAPSPLVKELMQENLIRIIPLSIPFSKKETIIAQKLQENHIIPKEAYDLPYHISTLAVETLWITTDKASSQLINKILTSFWSNQDANSNITNFNLNPKVALKGNTIPLHRGAEWYYAEKGYLH